MDTTAAGRLVAEQMEALEEDFGDEFEIGAVVTIVEVRGPDGSAFRIRNNLGDGAQVLGVLRLAEDEWIRHMRPGV
jgi:hypothetical protein